MVVILDTTLTSMLNNMTKVNITENSTLLTRRSVKVKGKDEEISDVEINTAFLRGPALPGAAVRETANSEETSQKMVLTSHIRERTAMAVKGGELHEKAKLHEKTKSHEKAKLYQTNQLLCQTLCTDSNLQEDALLDSVEVKEETEDAKRNIDNIFLSTKVNLLFLLIVLLWIFLLKKCIILNTVFLVHNIVILAGVSATLMSVNFCVNFLMSSTRAAMNTFDECDLFEKAMQFSVIAHDDNDDDADDESFFTKNCRSRYEKFLYLTGHTSTHDVRVRDREPSRIRHKKISSILHKSRNVRRLLRTYIKKNIPKSSRMHMFVNEGRVHVRSVHKRKVTSHSSAGKRIEYKCVLSSKRMHRKYRKHKMKLKTNYYLNKLMKSSSAPNVYKNLNHKINHCKLNLSKDVEINPGPPIDPLKTIKAPYSQDNVLLFGSNAGTQCVAMSFTSLIHNHRNGITSSTDLVNIMNTGNELYTALSRLSRQSYLLLTEVPEMITMFNSNYHLQYSPSYTGKICSCAMEDFDYCMPLENAIQALIGQSYDSFLLTILSSTVALYCTADGKFKIFDSHARDSFGIPHPQGTCVLLEVNTLNELINYFQMVYQNPEVIFELKGVHIIEMLCESAEIPNYQQTITHATSCNTDAGTINRKMPLEWCGAISFYCICFSIIKSCGYWNAQTLEAIIDHASMFYREKLYPMNEHLTINDFPSTLQIYDADISVAFNLEKQGILSCTSLTSKLMLQALITENTNDNTGFLMWISSYCISCIFEHKIKRNKNTVKYYLLALSADGNLEIFQNNNDLNSLIQSILNIVKNKFQSRDTEYCIKFLCCSSNFSSAVRLKVMAKHKSNSQKKLDLKRKKESYAQPAIKKKCLSDKHQKYESIDPVEKEKLQYNKREWINRWYNSLDPTEKEKVLSERAKYYKSLDGARKKKRAEWYSSQRSEDKEKLLCDRADWYSSLSPEDKEKLLSDRAEWYSSLNPADKEKLLCDRAEWYYQLDTDKKQNIKSRIQSNKKARKQSVQHELEHKISVFQSKIKEGPYYICSVCNRLLYRKTVIHLNKEIYNSQLNVFTDVKSFDDKQYICRTCHTKVLKGNVPCQAVCNKLCIDELPPELSLLEKLEQILIAQRIVFEKIIVMPKGQQRKIKGAICNVPVECDQTCKILPRPPERSGIIMLKLKRKLEFRGHVYFQAVRPEVVLNALNWLKVNNPFYTNISVDIGNIGRDLTTSQQNNNVSDEDNSLLDSDMTNTSSNQQSINDNNENLANGTMTDRVSPATSDTDSRYDGNTSDNEEQDDPLNNFRSPPNETCLQSIIPDYPVTVQENDEVSSGNEVYNIAPGENKHPVSFMMDKNCEELAFPVLFPKGEFGYTVERDVELSPVKYFNARLLHHSARFATNPEYLFFAQFIIEQKKVSDSINIALKKIHGQPLTASQIRSIDAQNLQNLICQDQAYLFLRQIPGSPPYWQRFMYEVIAMVKQLGIPTWFMTLSCADLRWPELFLIIARTQGKNLTDEQVDALSYNERCSMLNFNPVLAAKHFQYRVETFFTEVLLSNANPIGKIVYYALRIEFQMRGSPHLHALIWTSDCPKLTSETKEDYVDYIDQRVHAHLPNEDQDPELHELVKTYQKHSHSKTCRKYKNIKCRFNFGQFFTNRTIVAEPLSDDLDLEEKTNTLDKQKEILSLVKGKIDDVLNPSKSDYDPTLTEADIFTSVNITEEQYYWALSISPDSDYELHLRRPIDSCFINNYFVAGIKGFRANVDLQPVFNHCKCITYVCSYFTKDGTECSQAIVNVAKEAKKENMKVRDGLKKIGAAFLSTREVSSQECVYRCMPELWLRKIFPATIFVNTNLPEKRIRVAKSQQELDDLDDESTDIFKSNIVERYAIRPQSITSVDNLCLAEFAAYYYKDYRKDSEETSDAQPEILTDQVIEVQQNSSDPELSLPNKIRLMNTNEMMKCRKVRSVIRYHKPNKTKQPELYFHHLLMLYLPWRNETNLLGPDQTYASKFYELEVQAIVEQNRQKFEPDGDALNEALEFVRNNQGNIIHSYDSLNDQENEDLHSEMQDDSMPEESFNEQLPSHLASTSDQTEQHSTLGITTHNQPTQISDDELRQCVRSLNKRQRYAYDIVLTWCRNKLKNMNSLKPEELEPIYLFITGGAGAGKSHLIKTIYHTVTKTLSHAPMNPELPTVLLMAPTGVAAINIDGTTINTALAIPVQTGDNVPAMSDQKKTQMRLSLSELKLIIIDEISMVGNITLLHIHQRLKEIFGSSNSQMFAGISVIVVGDMYQLPPIRKKPVFANFKNDVFNLYHPWHLFTMIELTEIMRQKDDQPFAELLNRFRTASQTEKDIKCIQSRAIANPSENSYPSDALHIWAENNPVNQHNEMKLENITGRLFHLKAIDQYPPNVSQQDIGRVLARPRSETGGLDSDIYIKETARVMLTTNIDIADRLINGQLGTIVRIEVNQNNQNPTVIYIKFDDDKAGSSLIQRSSHPFIRENQVVPLQPVLAKIKIRPNKLSSPEIQRTQFPLTLAYAVSIHKVQGLSLTNVVISFDLVKQRTFNYGQIYVALSRATSLNGIHVLGTLENKHVKADPRVHEEYERLRNSSNRYLTIQTNENHHDDAVLTICLLNIRSLRNHSIDIKYDSTIMNSDIIALTETQLLPHSNDSEIKNDLQPFTLYRQDHPTDRFCSLALCTKNTVQTCDQQYFPQVNAKKFTIINNTTLLSYTILVLYRKNSSNISQYVQYLRNILNSNAIDMILGDFNINYLNNDTIQPLKSLMDSLEYSQIIQSPTFVSAGSTLDHVYVKPTFDIVQNSIVSVYYSDHDAIKISIKHK